MPDDKEAFAPTELLEDIDRDLRRYDWPADLRDETRRKIIALMLFSADHPDWAWTHFYMVIGRKSTAWIAEIRKLSQSTVRRLLTVRVPAEIYDQLPPEPRAKGE